MSRFIPLIAVLALGGCMVQPPNYVRYDAPAPDSSGYSDNYANRDAGNDVDQRAASDGNGYSDQASGYTPDQSNDSYAGDDQRGDYGDDDSANYADVPDYIEYPAYYSSLWPVYGSYYYPYSSPYFYPGVTFYPSGFYGAGYGGFGWGLGLSFGFGFSPWRSSYWDNYYNWGYWRHNYPNYGHYYPNNRFGGARNEAAQVASIRSSRYGQGFAAGSASNSRPTVSAGGLPTWGGQRAGGSSNARLNSQTAGQQRSSGFAGANAASRNNPANFPGNRAGAGNSYGDRGNARDGIPAVNGAGNRTGSSSSALPSASYRDQTRSNSGLNYRGNSSPSSQQNYSSGLHSSPRNSGSTQNYSGQPRSTTYRNQSVYGNANAYGNRGATSGARQSRSGGYMAHDYASPKADHYAAPRGYMSNSRSGGGFQGPYGGGNQSSRSSGAASHASGAARSGSSSSGGGGREGGHGH